MAVEVVKRVAHEIDCHSCKSTLSFRPEDIKVENHAVGYAGETWDPVPVIQCPVCGESVSIAGTPLGTNAVSKARRPT